MGRDKQFSVKIFNKNLNPCSSAHFWSRNILKTDSEFLQFQLSLLTVYLLKSFPQRGPTRKKQCKILKFSTKIIWLSSWSSEDSEFVLRFWLGWIWTEIHSFENRKYQHSTKRRVSQPILDVEKVWMQFQNPHLFRILKP